MLSILREFDDTFRALDALERNYAAGAASARWPAVRVGEQGDSFELQADLPGLKESDLEIVVEGDVVRLSGKREAATPDGYTPITRERPELSFSRAIGLSARVEADGVEATLHNGVLRVLLPKAKDARARAITVKAS